MTIGVCSDDLARPERNPDTARLMREGRLAVFPYAHPPSHARLDFGSGAGHRQQGDRLHWRTIEQEGEASFLDRLLGHIETDAVYITVDKDVLTAEDAATNWDQGRVRLPWLLDAIRAIGARHRVIGADVTGDYSRPVYAGSPWRRLATNVEIRLDQPRPTFDEAQATRVNEAANRALLAAFRDVMG